MENPELKQFGDLTFEDFERHPVWIGCHTVDSDEPWYNETDEETFRPSLSETPADPSEAMLLVRATFELQDGSRHDGFVTPSLTPDLGLQQPHLWVGERCFGFWGGLFGVPREERQAFYAAIGKPPEAVFPLRFSVDPALATGEVSGLLNGFYRHSGDHASPSIET